MLATRPRGFALDRARACIFHKTIYYLIVPILGVLFFFFFFPLKFFMQKSIQIVQTNSVRLINRCLPVT